MSLPAAAIGAARMLWPLAADITAAISRLGREDRA
jgi:hypothetical protein